MEKIEIIDRGKTVDGDTVYIYIEKGKPDLKRIITKEELKKKINDDFNLAIKFAKISWRELGKECESRYREAYNRAEFYKDIATHDMGNILNNIKTSVKLITMFQNKPDYSQKLNEMLNIIKSSVDRGVLLISNIRMLSKIEESENPLQSTEFNKFLEESIEFLHKSFQDKEIIVHVDNSKNKVLVKANNLLLDVFENILINATKYNENPIVFISIKIFEEKQQDVNYVRFEFEDNGVGVPDTQKELIFQNGFKKDKNVIGIGIGLSLVKKIIDSYKGKIWVEDKVKEDHTQGSNFIVLIPKAT